MKRKHIAGAAMALMISMEAAGTIYGNTYQFFSPDRGYVYVPESELSGKDLQQYMTDNHYFKYKMVPDAVADNYASDEGPGTTGETAGAGNPVIIVPESTAAASDADKPAYHASSDNSSTDQRETSRSRDNDRSDERRDETPVRNAEASHGPYRGITDEAESAFIVFCTDEIKDNAYITVTEDKDHMMISSNVISYTGSEKEDGSVIIKDENDRNIYEYTFPQLYFENTTFFDLYLRKEKRDNGLFVKFGRDQNFGASVRLRLLTPYKNGKVKVYDKDNNVLETADVDSDGYTEFNISRTQDMFIAPDGEIEQNTVNDVTETDSGNSSSYTLDDSSTKETKGDPFSTWQYGIKNTENVQQTGNQLTSPRTAADGKEYQMPSTTTVTVRKHTDIKTVLPAVFVALGAAGLIGAIILVLKKYFL